MIRKIKKMKPTNAKSIDLWQLDNNELFKLIFIRCAPHLLKAAIRLESDLVNPNQKVVQMTDKVDKISVLFVLWYNGIPYGCIRM